MFDGYPDLRFFACAAAHKVLLELPFVFLLPSPLLQHLMGLYGTCVSYVSRQEGAPHCNEPLTAQR